MHWPGCQRFDSPVSEISAGALVCIHCLGAAADRAVCQHLGVGCSPAVRTPHGAVSGDGVRAASDGILLLPGGHTPCVLATPPPSGLVATVGERDRVACHQVLVSTLCHPFHNSFSTLALWTYFCLCSGVCVKRIDSMPSQVDDVVMLYALKLVLESMSSNGPSEASGVR
jgi:hypothetical protein